MDRTIMKTLATGVSLNIVSGKLDILVDGQAARMDIPAMLAARGIAPEPWEMEETLASVSFSADRLSVVTDGREFTFNRDDLAREADFQSGAAMRPDDLVAWRKAVGVDREEAAGLLGVTPRTIRNYENGSTTIPRLVLLAVRALSDELPGPRGNGVAGPAGGGRIYLGRGFDWTTSHKEAADMLLLLRRMGHNPMLRGIIDQTRADAATLSSLGHKTDAVILPRSMHLVCAGDGAAGRCAASVAVQALDAGEPVFVIDLRNTTETPIPGFVPAGKWPGGKALPVLSTCRIPADVSSRFSAVLDHSPAALPFTDFCLKTVSTLSAALMAAGKPVTVDGLLDLCQGGAERLYEELSEKTGKGKNGTVAERRAFSDLALLVEYPASHFSKMITSLLPALVAVSTRQGEVDERWETLCRTGTGTHFLTDDPLHASLVLADLLEYLARTATRATVVLLGAAAIADTTKQAAVEKATATGTRFVLACGTNDLDPVRDMLAGEIVAVILSGKIGKAGETPVREMAGTAFGSGVPLVDSNMMTLSGRDDMVVFIHGRLPKIVDSMA